MSRTVLKTALTMGVLLGHAVALGQFGAEFTDPTPLNNNAESDNADDRRPGLATDGAGTWVAVWRSDENFDGIGTDFDILVAWSSDGGAIWTDPVPKRTNPPAMVMPQSASLPAQISRSRMMLPLIQLKSAVSTSPPAFGVFFSMTSPPSQNSTAKLPSPTSHGALASGPAAPSSI